MYPYIYCENMTINMYMYAIRSATYAMGSPLLVMFNMYAGTNKIIDKTMSKISQIVFLIGNSTVDQAFLNHWKSNVATIVSNRTDGEIQALIQMADRLKDEGNAIGAAHTCYLLGGRKLHLLLSLSL